MAGYSGTPLAKKLGIKGGHHILLLGAPDAFEKELGELPAGVRFVRSAGAADVVLLFSKKKGDLEKRLASVVSAIGSEGAIWIAWPKKSSGVPTDADEGLVRAIGLSTGLVDNKVCAIDEIWSGLRFVVRLKDRAAWAKRRRA